jgi:N-acetylmuramoyl-L-alanine amidase
MRRHRVQQGECISTLGFEYGFFPEAIWQAPENATLRQQRSSGFVLEPGDVVTIPDLRPKALAVETGQRHTFRRRGVPAYLRLELRDAHGAPQANVSYILEVDGVSREGRTTGAGRLEEPIPPNAQRAVLRFPETGATYEFPLGYLDPVSTVSGVQARLNNLGYLCGEVNGEWREECRKALAHFQAAEGLPGTGEADDATRARLLERHLS